MSCIRVLLLWVLILAVPFQRYAAASMAFCETEHAGPTVTIQKDSHQRSNASTHDSVHSHDMDAEDMGHHDADSGTAHKCGTCGACHAVALMPNTSIVRTQYLPAADLAEPRFLPVAFFPPLLERPPRA